MIRDNKRDFHYFSIVKLFIGPSNMAKDAQSQSINDESTHLLSLGLEVFSLLIGLVLYCRGETPVHRIILFKKMSWFHSGPVAIEGIGTTPEVFLFPISNKSIQWHRACLPRLDNLVWDRASPAAKADEGGDITSGYDGVVKKMTCSYVQVWLVVITVIYGSHSLNCFIYQ